MEELCYTSIAQGLDRGKTGFTVAGRTSAMSKTLSDQAEKLSGFDALDSNNPMGYAREPVQYSHLVMRLSGGRSHIVTRRAACPPDYTGRSNFLAHHALLSEAEAAACRGGPAALAAHDGFLMTKWEGDARSLPNRPVPALIDRGPSAAAFEAAGLDAGWAASLADRVLDPGTRQTWLIYGPDMNILGMVADVLSQVDPANRWAMTFATHATRSFPGPGADCRIQCVVAGTEYAREVVARRGADVFDLTTRGAAPPRRPQASVAQPAGRTVTATRGGFPAAGGAAARGPTRPLDPTPIGQDEFLLPSPPRQTSTGKPDYRGRGDGFGLPWVAIPAALAVAMTFATALTGYLWQTTNQTVERQVDEIRTLKDEIRDLKKAHKLALADQQADVEAKRKDSPPPAQATAETPDKKGDDEKKTSPESESEAAPPAEMKSDTQRSPKPDSDTAPAPPPASSPSDSTAPSNSMPMVSHSVIEDVKQAIAEKKANPSVTLLTNIGEQPPKDAVSLLPNDTPIDLLEAQVKPPASIFLLGKKAAAIRYSEKEKLLILDITKNSDTAFLLKYVTLRIEGVGAQPIDIALGRPVDAVLWMRPASQGDREQQSKGKTRDIGWQFNLFKTETDSGEEATKQLQLVLSSKAGTDKKLLEHFEFGDEKVITRLKKESKPSPGDTFTFYTTGTANRPIGVQFIRSSPVTPDLRPPPTYKLHGLYFTVVSRVDENLLKYDAITQDRFDDIGKEVRQAISRLNTDRNKKVAEKVSTEAIDAKLKTWQDNIATDKGSWEEAKAFPHKLLEDRPFRLTLKPRGSTDKGIVVVDSLSGNAGPKAGSEENRR